MANANKIFNYKNKTPAAASLDDLYSDMQRYQQKPNVRNTFNVGKSGYCAVMLRMQMNNHAERWRKLAKRGLETAALRICVDHRRFDNRGAFTI